jgi:hypothetical protein
MPEIVLRVFVRPDAMRALVSDRTIASEVDLESRLYFEVGAGSELWQRVLQATKDTSGVAITPIVSFASAELNRVQWFQLRPAIILPESDADYRVNKARLERLEPVQSSASTAVRLLDQIVLSGGRLRGESIGVVGEWTEEYVTSPAVMHQLRELGITGLAERPVLALPDMTARPDVVHLFSERIVPPIRWDESTVMMEDQPPTPASVRQLGCLTYESCALERVADFNRTAEPWAGNGMPSWIVSRRVRTGTKKAGIRGWRFVPVLEAESSLYRVYRERWLSLWRELTTANPQNAFR